MSLILTATVSVSLLVTQGSDVGVTQAKVFGPPSTVICYAEWEALPVVTCWRQTGEVRGVVGILERFETKVAPKETEL